VLVHFVLFWLKKGISAAERAEFRQGLESLRAVPSAQALYVGAPVASDRDVVEKTYDFALTVVFADAASLEAYQVHPTHKAFVEKNRPRWEKLRVHDAQ
jgi:hypothetical protein